MSDPIFTPAVDAAITSGATKTTIWAGLTSGFAGLLSQLDWLPAWVRGLDWLSIGGFVIAGASFAVSWYFKRVHVRMDKRFKAAENVRRDREAADAHRESELRQQLLERQIETQHSIYNQTRVTK